MTTSANAASPSRPIVGLLARYAVVFKATWQHRHELAGPKRLTDEAAFLPAALSLQETPPHPAPRRALWVICLLFIVALVWAIVGEIDIVAVAQGRIIVSQRSKLIQPLEASVVKAIHVKDGDHVQQGQLLIELDATTATADNNRVTQERNAAISESLRAETLTKALGRNALPPLPPGEGWGRGGGLASAGASRLHIASRYEPAPQSPAATVEPHAASPASGIGMLADARPAGEGQRREAQSLLLAEWSDITARLARLDAEYARRKAEAATVEEQIAKLRATLPLASQREQDVRGLAEQGFMSGHAGQDRARERIELERDLATTLARKQETLAALRESEHAKLAYKAETLRALRERLTQADLKQRQLGEEFAKTRQRTRLTQLTAPVSGTVQQLIVHTAGGVVTPAQVLLIVVPDNAEVTAEVTLENKDVGFVRERQEATVKLETFPYTRYGTVVATVSTITADAVNDEKRGAIFPATLALAQSALNVDGKTIRLTPGMNLTAEIKTGKRRVIDFLLSPVQRHANESLKER